MPSFVIHIAIANEYMKKHNKKENYEEFIKGNIKPDLTDNKEISHYGEKISYIYLKKFLESNDIEGTFNRGYFLHLITDYLFYNNYLDCYIKDKLYNDYYILNKDIIPKYNIQTIEEIKEFMRSKEGITQVLNLELVYKLIEEVSSLDIDEVAREVRKNNEKWNEFKNLMQ